MSLYDIQVLEQDSDSVGYVRDLIKKFKEFGHLSNSEILIVANHKKKPDEEKLVKGEGTYATISRISPKMIDIIEQVSGTRYSFIIEIISSEYDPLDSNQQKAILYFELSRIDSEYKLRKIDSNDWIKILHGIGKEFKRQDSTCTDILGSDFTWEKCVGSYFNQLEN
jgi:hypothetical protein